MSPHFRQSIGFTKKVEVLAIAIAGECELGNQIGGCPIFALVLCARGIGSSTVTKEFKNIWNPKPATISLTTGRCINRVLESNSLKIFQIMNNSVIVLHGWSEQFTSRTREPLD